MDDAAAAISKRIKAKGASSGYCPLPEEIVEDILSRLPAKSLCRFLCVSRSSFDAVISSRTFQDTDYRRNRGADRRLFIRPPGVHEPFYAWRPGGDGGLVVETIMSTRRLPQGSIFPVSKSGRCLVLLKKHRLLHAPRVESFYR
ncbi:hypothetical protein BAE44_0021571 [Dichanthelium oligosanthes]|uniref:F-box domain-containing protein n=1 Tax=Dichanthelium oligosanthes TaxID=888268 RepID=A0A1E5UX28_9POAL|nr:hypothetical protein BAE44_0021571 [Dichanthelium oligosanthes]